MLSAWRLPPDWWWPLAVTGGNQGVGLLVLEESRRVSGTYKVVLIVLTYMGVSQGSK